MTKSTPPATDKPATDRAAAIRELAELEAAHTVNTTPFQREQIEGRLIRFGEAVAAQVEQETRARLRQHVKVAMRPWIDGAAGLGGTFDFVEWDAAMEQIFGPVDDAAIRSAAGREGER